MEEEHVVDATSSSAADSSKERGKSRYGGRKDQSRSRRNMRVAAEDGDRSEYQESVGGDEKDTVRDERRRLMKAECAMYSRGIGRE